jgi:N-acetylmuramoyl-L-alanine amidase
VIKIVNIIENLIPLGTPHIISDKNGSKRNIVIRNGKKIKPSSLTIHSTGNPSSTAQNERNWLVNLNNNSDASWNIVVDEKEAIIAIPFDEKSNHSGSAKGNETSVGLEICESGDREKTLINAIETSVYILNKLNINTIYQHYDWNKKNCPRILRDTGRWDWFVNEIKSRLSRTSKFADDQVKEAMDYLNSRGIILDKEYWLNNLAKVKNLDLLLIKFANEVAKNNV